MTALAAAARPRPAARGPRGASPPSATRRAVGTWQEPNTWTVGILLATGVAIIARHPIARAIGTEVDTPASSVTTSAPAAPARALPAAPSLSLPVAAVPTHTPRDPFRALVAAGASAVAAQSSSAAAAPPASVPTATTPSTPVLPVTPVATATCASTHRVRIGESLWTIASKATGSTEVDRVTTAWHRVYDANRARVGSDPSMLRVGTQLCIPKSL